MRTVISQLNNSAPGHDGLPPSIMKQLTNEYVIPLTHLINLSIVQGDFPSELKLAKVLPIYKSEREHFTLKKGHSTSHAIITLVEKVSKALDTGKIVVGVYLDIRKAFDCVRHSTLLDKLHKIGIRGNLFCLIKSYLMSRTQYVHYNGCNSSTKSIEYGVPKDQYWGPCFSFYL